MVRSSCQILDTVPTITGNGSNRLNTYCNQPRHHSKHQPQGLCPRISHLPSLQIPGRYNETTSRTKILFPSQPFPLLSAVTTSDSSANPSVICVSHGVPTWSNLSLSFVCARFLSVALLPYTRKWTVQTEGMDGDERWGDLWQKRNLQEIRPSWFRRQEWDLPWRMVYRTWLCDRREMKLEKRGWDGLDMCWGESGDKDVGDGAARQEGKEGITREDLWVEWRRTWR